MSCHTECVCKVQTEGDLRAVLKMRFRNGVHACLCMLTTCVCSFCVCASVCVLSHFRVQVKGLHLSWSQHDVEAGLGQPMADMSMRDDVGLLSAAT